MSGLSAVYVRLEHAAQDLARLREGCPKAGEAHPASGYALAASRASATAQPADPCELSEEFNTDAIVLGLETVGGLLIYEHWRGGELLRTFTYTGDSGWSNVEGDAEDWEGGLFSAPIVDGELLPHILPEEAHRSIKDIWRLP